MRILILSLVTLFFIPSISAQGPKALLLGEKPSLEVSSQLVKFEKQTQSALTIIINAPSSDVSKGWKKFLSEKYQLEVKKMKGGVMVEQASLADISTDKLDLYSLLKDDEKGTRLDLLVNKNGTFISEKDNPTEVGAFKRLLKQFAKSFYVGYYEDVVAEERKSADKLQKEYDKSVSMGEKLVKEGQGLEGDITKANEDITSIDNKIADLQAKKEALNNEIASSKSKIKDNKSAVEANVKDKSAKKKVLDTQVGVVNKLKVQMETFK